MELTQIPGINAHLKISTQPNIGLDGEARMCVIQILNTVMADEGLLTMKTHSAQWHVRGPGFLDLRALFNQQFQQLNETSNEIAERVSMLGGFAVSSFGEFLHFTRLVEHPGKAPDVIDLLADHEASVRFLRDDARKCLEEYEDDGTYALLVRLIYLHEKMAWILRSHIEPEMAHAESQENRPHPIQP